MNPVQKILDNQGFLIIDGGLATELEAKGQDLNDPLWSAKCLEDAQEAIIQVHRSYFAAGADVAITASYQASFEGFSKKGYPLEKAKDLLQRSVDLALEARRAWWETLPEEAKKERVYPIVAASVGSYGAFLADGSEYSGQYVISDEELANFHRPRLQILGNSGADILAFETIPCAQEARVICRLLREEFPYVFAWISFSCKDGESICGGSSLRECVDDYISGCAQCVAVGVNCTSPLYVDSLLRSIQGCPKATLAYPNSGEGYDADKKVWLAETGFSTSSFGEMVQMWRKAGASLLGGCCRTNPRTIQEVRYILKQESKPYLYAASEHVN